MAAYMLSEYSPTVVGCTYQSAALTKHKFIFKGYKDIAGKVQVFIDEDLYTEIRSGTQMAGSACVGRTDSEAMHTYRLPQAIYFGSNHLFHI